MSHFVYTLQSQKDNKYYIGKTADVSAGLIFHNPGKQRSTKNSIPFIIILIEEFETRKASITTKNKLKVGKVISLLRSSN
jgi:putative endonuclease